MSKIDEDNSQELYTWDRCISLFLLLFRIEDETRFKFVENLI